MYTTWNATVTTSSCTNQLEQHNDQQLYKPTAKLEVRKVNAVLNGDAIRPHCYGNSCAMWHMGSHSVTCTQHNAHAIHSEMHPVTIIFLAR